MSPQSTQIQNIDLPSGAYHPSEDKFEAPPINNKDYPSTVSSVEQLLRAAFAIGGRHNGLDLAQKAIQFQKEYEQENVFSDFIVDRSRIEESNDIWLSETLDTFADERQAILNKEKKKYDNRMHWFNEDIMERLQDKKTRATKMLRDGVEFKVVRIVTDADDAEHKHEIPKHDLSGVDISKFGYNAPVTLTVCHSSGSGKLYPFVPWCGTTVCTGPYKHDNPVSTLCKHEIAALIQYAEDQYQPSGPNIHERFKRLISPKAYNRFTQNISP